MALYRVRRMFTGGAAMPRNNPPARKLKLTQAVVLAARHDGPRDRTCIYDTECRGLYLVVYPSGRRSFYIAYRVAGRLRRHAIGELGDVTLHQARERAHDIRIAARAGHDPVADRRRARDRMAVSVADWWARYREHAAPGWKPNTVTLNDFLWAKCIAPVLGARPIAGLTVADVDAWQRALARDKPGNARFAMRVLRAMLNHAVSMEAMVRNPAARVKSLKANKRERFLSEVEFARLLDAIAVEQASGAVSPHAAGLFRLLMLTGARLREVMLARWDWVAWGDGCLELPDSKTGAKRVPLSTHAMAELRRLEAIRTVGHEWIIEGKVPGCPMVNAQKPWARVRQRAGLGAVRIHDLRHSFASMGAKLGLSAPILGKALGHANIATTERYLHLDADPVLAASERIGAEIMACSRVVPAVVVEVDRAKAGA
jgi:integrase